VLSDPWLLAPALVVVMLRCLAIRVPAMPAMHENVHQRTKQQNRVGPPLRQVGAMFGP